MNDPARAHDESNAPASDTSSSRSVAVTPPTAPSSAPARVQGERLAAPQLDPRVEAAIEALRSSAARLAEQARADALEIGFAVARRILEQELTTNPKALFKLIRSAIERIGESRRLRVRLSPEDLERIQAQGDLTHAGLSLATVELVADRELSLGDVVVEGEQGSVDGRLHTRLTELARAVDENLDEVA